MTAAVDSEAGAIEAEVVADLTMVAGAKAQVVQGSAAHQGVTDLGSVMVKVTAGAGWGAQMVSWGLVKALMATAGWEAMEMGSVDWG